MTLSADATWGARLKARRLAEKLTQVGLSNLTGVSQETISAYEHDKIRPSDARRILLARALRCHVYDLFPYDREDVA